MMTEKFAMIHDDDILSWDELTTDDEMVKQSPDMTLPGITLSPGQGDDASDDTSPYDQSDIYQRYCDAYLDFTNENPTTYHVTEYFHNLLVKHGFKYIVETDAIASELAYEINQGGKFFTSRGDLTIIAFVIGANWVETQGLSLVGAHIDVLTAKLKPNSTRPKIDGYETLGVANYSGALSDVWVDRDLGIGGSILVDNGDKIIRKTYKSPGPIGRIPSLAPHFGVKANYNLETNMVPVIGYETSDETAIDEKILNHPLANDHSTKLLDYIVKTSGIDIDTIIDLELEMYDTHHGTKGGINNDFIFAPRIDDRLCSFAAIHGLIEYSKTTDVTKTNGLSMTLLADHEEVGSTSRSGAKGQFLSATLEKILSIKKGLKSVVYANSLLLSADVTHAMNPNFKNVYLDNHYPLPNIGLSLKFDPNAHTMTDKVGFNIMRQIAATYDGQIQRFQIRNDSRSGGTIGPMLATETGSRVVDVGLPILSMHSIRAACGYKGPGIGVQSFSAFFTHWKPISEKYKGL